MQLAPKGRSRIVTARFVPIPSLGCTEMATRNVHRSLPAPGDDRLVDRVGNASVTTGVFQGPCGRVCASTGPARSTGQGAVSLASQASSACAVEIKALTMCRIDNPHSQSRRAADPCSCTPTGSPGRHRPDSAQAWERPRPTWSPPGSLPRSPASTIRPTAVPE